VKPAAVVPKPKDPERPTLFLVGTVANGHERFAVFLDQSTKAAVRLRMGDDYQGWTLRSVQGREATLEKDQQAVILALPQPGDPRASDVAWPFPKAGTLLSATSSSRRERSSH
jgi:general secretion pathway protein N